jgi:hypothetical protein
MTDNEQRIIKLRNETDYLIKENGILLLKYGKEARHRVEANQKKIKKNEKTIKDLLTWVR